MGGVLIVYLLVDQATDEAVKKRETEELGDAMKALENRTLDSKQEMDIMAALDEMKSMRVCSRQLFHVITFKLVVELIFVNV